MRLPKNILSGSYRPPVIYLCQTNKDRIGELSVRNVEGKFKWVDYSEISFDIDRKINDEITGDTIINPYYDWTDGLRLVEVEGFGFFQLQDPEEDSDGILETKSMSAKSLEYDLSNRYLENFSINKGTVESIDGVQFYNQNDTEHSLLHLIIAEKAPDWSIGHVDEELKTQKRFFEIERESVYDFLMNEVSETFKCVIIFDTFNNTINAYKEESAGSETDVIISFDNLVKNINVKYSTDDIKTVLTVQGADELNIREVNFGLPYISDLSYYHTVEWMGQELYDAYSNYLNVIQFNYDKYIAAREDVLKNRKAIDTIKNKVDENLNETKIEDFWKFLSDFYKNKKVDPNKMSTISVDFSYIDRDVWNNFKTTMESASISESTKWIAVDNFLSLIWRDSGLNELKSYEAKYKEQQTAQAEHGMSIPSSSDYYQYYATYVILRSIQIKIPQINSSIDTLNENVNSKIAVINEIGRIVSVPNNFTQEQIIRLAPFMREDLYKDENFLITDIDTEEEKMETMEALLDAGKTELAKLSSPKLSFTTSMANIFALEEFDPIINQFQLGNMIKIEIRDGYIKKSRLMEVDIKFHKLDDFEVTFGDLLSIRSEADIHADLLSLAINAGKSVAKNASYWQKGTDTVNAIQNNINNGLLDAATEIKSIDGVQATSIDKYGIHLQSIDSNGNIDPEQGWIVSNKFLYTDDNWKTTKSVFGKYTYKGEERWGVLTDALIGGFVQGTEIEGGSIKIGDRGDGTYALVVTSDGTVEINAWGGKLNDIVAQVESPQYDVMLESTTTPILTPTSTSTILKCHIYLNGTEITPTDGTTFSWIRSSNDTAGDEVWNAANANKTTNTITITTSDIDNNAQFSCEVNIP